MKRITHAAAKKLALADIERITHPQLKPCPFCGGTPRLSLRINSGFKPFCLNCRCQLGTFPTSAMAVGGWNRRPK
jgi:hypothetical protein